MTSEKQQGSRHHSERHHDLSYRRYATALVAGMLLLSGAIGALAIGLDLGRPAAFNACLCLVLVGAIMMTSAWGGTVEVIAQVDERSDEIAKIKGQICELTEALRRVATEATADADELAAKRRTGQR